MTGVICIKNDTMVMVRSYKSAANGVPMMKDPAMVDGTNVTNSISMDGKLYCSYRRKLTVPPGSQEYMLNLTTNIRPMWAAGPNQSPGMIGKHPDNLRSNNTPAIDIRFQAQVKNSNLLPLKNLSDHSMTQLYFEYLEQGIIVF